MVVDWQSLFFEKDWLSKLDRLAQMRFGDSSLASEAANYAFEQMSSNNWDKLNQFKGDAKPETYLRAVSSNYLEEFSRKKFGRPRPPKWLEDRGPLWVTTWKMVCIERQLQETVLERLHNQFQRDKDILLNAIRTVQGKLPWCGHKHMEIPESAFASEDEESESFINTVPNQNDASLEPTNTELAESLFVISSFLNQEIDSEQLLELNEKHYRKISHLQNAITTFHNTLKLEDDEIIVLKMIYQDGFKKKQIANLLDIPEYQPGRIAKSAIKKIKAALKKTGVDIEEVENLVREHLG